MTRECHARLWEHPEGNFHGVIRQSVSYFRLMSTSKNPKISIVALRQNHCSNWLALAKGDHNGAFFRGVLMQIGA